MTTRISRRAALVAATAASFTAPAIAHAQTAGAPRVADFDPTRPAAAAAAPATPEAAAR